MRIKDILRQRPGELICIAPEATLRDAAVMMAEHNVSALVVSPADGSLAGILTERDIARHFAAGKTLAEAVVSDAMTRNVITCSADHDVGEIAMVMSESNIRHMPIVKNGEPLDIVSIRDIVRFHLAAMSDENRTLRELVAALD